MKKSTQNLLNDFIEFSKLPVFSADDFYSIHIQGEIDLQGYCSLDILQKYESYGYVFIDHNDNSKRSEINFGNSVIRIILITKNQL